MTGCADCGLVPDPKAIIAVMIEMEPGPDGKPWRRCVRCHLQGARAKKPNQETAS